ncbi:MAG: tyrosine-type recombinase/integrase [Planctomycetota bacterium]|jgi:integrase
MGVYRKGDKWFIDYYYHGRRIRELAGHTKTQAEKALQIRKAEILQGKFKIQDVKPSPRFEDFVKQFLEWSRDNKRSWHRDRTLVLPLIRFFGRKCLREITPWIVERYKHERLKATVRGKPIAPATVNRELACLRRMFSLAIRWERADGNPAARFKRLQEPNHAHKILSSEEIDRLLTACTSHSRAMVLLALHTGMRLGEILELTWERVDLSQGVITLIHTKNGRVRRVPLNGAARELLNSWPRSGPYVFGGNRPYGSIKTAFRAACRRAGLGRIRFHDLRHTWATHLVLAGVDLRTVQELGGWSSLALVERYSHPTSEARRHAVQVLESVYSTPDGHHLDTTARPPLAIRPVSTVK